MLRLSRKAEPYPAVDPPAPNFSGSPIRCVICLKAAVLNI